MNIFQELINKDDLCFDVGANIGAKTDVFLVLGAKCNALLNGKYSPDIEDVKAVAKPVLRHRIVRNFKAEAEGITVDGIIEKLIAVS